MTPLLTRKKQGLMVRGLAERQEDVRGADSPRRDPGQLGETTEAVRPGWTGATDTAPDPEPASSEDCCIWRDDARFHPVAPLRACRTNGRRQFEARRRSRVWPPRLLS
jgi:hypothetical protein